ncbi:hypothetical protein ACLSY8_08215 [Avibacterium avium]
MGFVKQSHVVAFSTSGAKLINLVRLVLGGFPHTSRMGLVKQSHAVAFSASGAKLINLVRLVLGGFSHMSRIGSLSKATLWLLAPAVLS